jgi:Zn-dependent protease with chaperone function
LGDGLVERRPGLINMGVLVFLAVALGRFFSSEASFTAKGVVFIVCGGVFLATNLVVSRRMKQTGGAA